MENSLTFNDIKILLKQKKRMLLTTILVTSVLFGTYAAYYEFFDTQGGTSIIDEALEPTGYDLNELMDTDPALLTDSETEFLTETLFEEAYSFRIYIEHQNGNVFERSNLLEELLLSEDTIDQIETETSRNISYLRDYFLDVDLNSNNVIYTITVGLGDRQANEAVSNAYYEALQSEEIEIINTKVTKLFEAPEVVVSDEPSVEDVNVEEESGSISAVVIALLVGSIFGAVLGVLLIFIRSVIESKITPVFNYRLTERDEFINLSHLTMDNAERFNALVYAVMYPASDRKLILSQDSHINEKIKQELEQNESNHSTVIENVNDVDPNIDFDSLVIITQNQLTEKIWYKKQKSLLKIYDKSLRIIKLK